MKSLKIKIYQETVCYKKPFAFKVTETYPLPPYSTIIGMLHNVMGVKSGEYIPMDISVQGNYEGIFNTYNTTMFYKKKDVTSMPMNVHLLLGVNLIIHVSAEENILLRIIDGFRDSKESFTLGRREDLARLDSIKLVNLEKVQVNKFSDESYLLKNNTYIPQKYKYRVNGITYMLNKKYTILNDLRSWEKVEAIYAEKGEIIDQEYLIDDDTIEQDIVFLG